MRTLSSLLFLLALFLMACGGDATTTEAETTDEEEMTDDMSDEMASSGITITDFPETKSYPDAGLTSMSYNNGTFTFNLNDDDEYKLGQQTPDADQLMCANSAKGQHIHLIVDNEPYNALYEPMHEMELADGEHYVLAFLSRSYHQSLKNPQAFLAKKLTVSGAKATASNQITEPMLFYSRPKGTYVGDDINNLLLDFYPVNVELGEQYRVKVAVNGEEIAELDEWKSYKLEGLEMGDNRIELTLINADGMTVDAPFNPVERVITLKEDPAPEM